MEYRQFKNKYIVRLDKGEEIVENLKKLVKEEGITLGSVTGIGAVNKAVIGLFETSTKKYHSREITGDHEITSLAGNISTMGGEVYLHLHINLANSELVTCGGHLTSATVSATGEIVVDVIEGAADRKFSEEIGLNLFKFD